MYEKRTKVEITHKCCLFYFFLFVYMLVLAEWWFVKPGHRSAFRMTISANSSINHRSGKVWWQRLKEWKRHRWASDYCNCHQIPTRTLALSSPASLTHQHSRHQPRPEWHRCFAHTRTHIHTLSTCPLTRLWIIFLSVFFLILWVTSYASHDLSGLSY